MAAGTRRSEFKEKEQSMHVSIRRYKTDSASEVARRVNEQFVNRISNVTGFLAYYVIDTGEGALASIKCFRDEGRSGGIQPSGRSLGRGKSIRDVGSSRNHCWRGGSSQSEIERLDNKIQLASWAIICIARGQKEIEANHRSGFGNAGSRSCRESRKRSFPAGKALTRLVENQGTPTARIRCLRLHRRKRKSKAFWSVAAWCISKREATLLRSFGYRFSEKGLTDAIDRLRPFFIDKPPVENPPKIPEKIQWVQPKLVCEVAFAEWTTDEQLRQTTFLGWRDDKSPEEVVLERS